MMSRAVIAQTEHRYAQRTPDREAKRQKIASGALLEADEPRRVAARLKRLATSARVVERVVPLPVPPPPSAPPVPDAQPVEPIGLALERIIGKSDLIGITFLELGLIAARAKHRLQRRLATIQDEDPTAEDTIGLLDFSQQAAARFPEQSPAEQRELLQLLVDKAT